MAENNELKRIKKMYGENFMKLCRDLFASILDEEGRLTEILSKRFSKNSKTLYEDIVKRHLELEFKEYIYSNVEDKNKEKTVITRKTPYELLDEAGYNLIECNTEEEIQEFKKYYAPKEQLCTFRGGRLNRSVIFFAVRKDVENIKRENYSDPQREDEYSTSVLGIQFNKTGKCRVDIISRYNHTVINPNATYGCDLNNITPELEESFAELLKERGLFLNSSNKEQLRIPGYVFVEEKYYKYNQELNGIYYCPGNIIIDGGNVIHLNNNQELVDYFIIDSKEKKVYLYDEYVQDSFIDDLQDLDKIEIIKDREKANGSRKIVIKKNGRYEPIIVNVDKNNQIIGYTNKELVKVGDDFLFSNKKLEKMHLPRLKEVGNAFLAYNEELRELEEPYLEKAGTDFLSSNNMLEKIDLFSLKEVSSNFLYRNEELKELDLPNLEKVGDYFLSCNSELEKLYLPRLKKVDGIFLSDNEELRELNLPNVEKIGDYFMSSNGKLEKIYLPKLKEVQDNFLFENVGLKELEIPNLQKVGDKFLYNNEKLEKIDLPRIKEVKEGFLYRNEALRKLEMPKLEKVGNYFLSCNKKLEKLDLPRLKEVGKDFLSSNEELRELVLLKLEKAGDFFLYDNNKLEQIHLPRLKEVEGVFLLGNNKLMEMEKMNLGKVEQEVLKRQETPINSKDIAKVDKESELTTSEISQVGKMIEKMLDRINSTIKRKDR